MSSACLSSRSLICATDSPTSAPAANDRFIRSIAQNRLTAVGREFLCARRFALANTERQAHGCRDADCRSTANDHRLDGSRDFLGGLAANVDFLRRQLA